MKEASLTDSSYCAGLLGSQTLKGASLSESMTSGESGRKTFFSMLNQKKDTDSAKPKEKKRIIHNAFLKRNRDENVKKVS